MNDKYEDYVQPPSYTEKEISDDDPLISKIKFRIQQDLNQINGVYDSKILEHEQNKSKKIKQIDLEYRSMVENINKKRKEDIDKYNENAEYHINTLISSMNSNNKKPQKWWEWVFNII